MHCPTLSELPPPPPGKSGWPWTEENLQLPIAMANSSLCRRVSIVTPSFNQGDYLEETIRSVLLQGYPNLEYWIMDGGSSDHSVEIIRRYEPWLAGWISEKDGGQSEAINKGWRRSSGEFLAWINSDDILLPDAISTTVDFLLSHPSCGFVYGDIFIMDEAGETIGYRAYNDFNIVDLILTAGWISQQGNLFRRLAYEQVGELDDSLHFQMDFDYWLRIGLKFDAGYMNKPLARFRQYRDAKTGSQTYLAANDILKIYKKIYLQDFLPEPLVKNKRRAWANAYAYSAECMCLSNKFPEAYRRIFRAGWFWPGILFYKHYWRKLSYLIVLSMLGGKYSVIGRLVSRVLHRIKMKETHEQ